MKWRKPKQMTLVEELIDMGESPDVLRAAACEYYENRPLLGRYLVENGVVPQERVSRALARQAEKRGDLRAASAHLAEASASLTDLISLTFISLGKEVERFIEKVRRRDG
ncbi:MAG: hypothetical protein A2Y75_01465 [Candidatus Solincola sediminis]|uniref:Uncharacterized protein n=1 Tax=Candidatus Solincola sediminis TaxID=1797199 RepID=A0A1F2WNI8_9ACTN|nr:MAG: hypothetical protein A2Y75_01465 [Candidatus Solincola sediminis]